MGTIFAQNSDLVGSTPVSGPVSRRLALRRGIDFGRTRS
jgi:hypothetical protein